MLTYLKQASLLFLISLQFSLQAAWIDRKAEGWAWYQDPQEKTSREYQKPALSSSQELAIVRKELEEKLAKAVLEPTSENILAYMQEQQKWLGQSSEFSKLWTQILLQHPSLDNTTRVPVSQYGLQVYKKMLQEQKEELVSNLSKENGLFFFYEGDNLASQAFAEVVKNFSNKYTWKVIGISVDGKILEAFDTKLDNGISKKFGITVFPSLILVNPKEDIVAPISFGLASLDQIEENLFVQFSNEAPHAN